MTIDFLFVEAAIENYSTKIGVKKFRYTLHWSCPGVVVKTFENTSEGITKIMICFKGVFQGFYQQNANLKWTVSNVWYSTDILRSARDT